MKFTGVIAITNILDGIMGNMFTFTIPKRIARDIIVYID